MPNVPPAPDWILRRLDQGGRGPGVRQVEIRREVRQTATLRAHDERLIVAGYAWSRIGFTR